MIKSSQGSTYTPRCGAILSRYMAKNSHVLVPITELTSRGKDNSKIKWIKSYEIAVETTEWLLEKYIILTLVNISRYYPPRMVLIFVSLQFDHT